MAEFYVIYFDYDQQFNSVAKTKVKLENIEKAKAGDSCSVPFETLEIGDNGKEVYITENYKGTIICIGQGMNIFFGVSHGSWKLVTTK